MKHTEVGRVAGCEGGCWAPFRLLSLVMMFLIFVNRSSFAPTSYSGQLGTQTHSRHTTDLENMIEVSMQLTAGGLDAVEVISVARYNVDDKLIGNEVLPESSRGGLATLERCRGLAHVVSGLFQKMANLQTLSTARKRQYSPPTVRPLIPSAFAVAEAVISAIDGNGPPAALLPLEPSVPGPPFMAYEGRGPGGGKGAAALIIAAYAQKVSRMVGVRSLGRARVSCAGAARGEGSRAAGGRRAERLEAGADF